MFGDGHQTRCFSYVGDIVPASGALSPKPRTTRGQAFNLGGAQEISILDLATRIIELTDSSSEIVLVPYEQAYGEGYEDMRRRVPDNSRAERMLGFVPATGLDEIIYAVAAGLKEKDVVSALACLLDPSLCLMITGCGIALVTPATPVAPTTPAAGHPARSGHPTAQPGPAAGLHRSAGIAPGQTVVTITFDDGRISNETAAADAHRPRPARNVLHQLREHRQVRLPAR